MNSWFNSFNLITVTISSFTPAIPGNQYEYVTACSAGSAQASYTSRLKRHGVLERKRVLDESKDSDSIEGVASERKRVLSCWNLNRGHGRLFDGNLSNTTIFFYRCLRSSFCTVSFDLSPFALLTPSFASGLFPHNGSTTLFPPQSSPFGASRFSLWLRMAAQSISVVSMPSPWTRLQA